MISYTQGSGLLNIGCHVTLPVGAGGYKLHCIGRSAPESVCDVLLVPEWPVSKLGRWKALLAGPDTS